MKKAGALLILLLATTVHSQDIASLYSEFLPRAVINDTPYLNSVIQRIEEKAKINPELIYFYIAFLDKQFNENSTQPDVFKNNGYVRIVEQYYGAERNEWIESLMKTVKKSNIHKQIKNKINKHLQKFIIQSLSDSLEKTAFVIPDTNAMHYYSSIYIRGAKTDSYDPAVNYYRLKKGVMHQKRMFFVAMYNQIIEQKGIEYLEAIDELLNFWYLYKDNFCLRQQDLETGPFITDFFAKAYQNHYHFNEGRNLYFISGVSLQRISSRMDHIIGYYYFTTHEPKGIDINKTLSCYQAGFFIGGRYHLPKRYLSPFSYIEFKAFYSTHIASQNESIDDTKDWETIHYSTHYREHYDITNSKIQIKNSHYFQLQFSTPLISLKDKIIIECAVCWGRVNIKYNLKYDFYYRWEKDVLHGPLVYEENDSTDKDEKISNTVFYPALNIKGMISSKISITFSAHTDYLSIYTDYAL